MSHFSTFQIRSPERCPLSIRSELNIAVHDALGSAGIVIPFPRREVSVDSTVDVRIVRPKRLDGDR